MLAMLVVDLRALVIISTRIIFISIVMTRFQTHIECNGRNFVDLEWLWILILYIPTPFF